MPHRRVVLAAGDGGFLYQAQEFATAMHHHLPVVAVVFDDGAFGNVRRIQKEQYGNRLIRVRPHQPRLRQIRRKLRRRRVPRHHTRGAGRRLARRVRRRQTRADPRAGRRDAQPLGHDPAAPRARGGFATAEHAVKPPDAASLKPACGRNAS